MCAQEVRSQLVVGKICRAHKSFSRQPISFQILRAEDWVGLTWRLLQLGKETRKETDEETRTEERNYRKRESAC